MSASTAFSDTIELLRHAQAGDSDSLGKLMERYRQRLLGRIRLLMGPEARRTADSGDFLQGVMVEIIAGLPQFMPSDDRAFMRWATRIARNNIHDALRRHREQRFADLARTTFDASLPDVQARNPHDVARDQELIEVLLDGLEQLPPEQQTVIELRDFERLSFAEIGAQMQRSDNAAQLLHARAVIALGRSVRG